MQERIYKKEDALNIIKKKEIFNLEDTIFFLENFEGIFLGIRYRLNNKPMKCKKILKILKNNFSKQDKFFFKTKTQKLPLQKGDTQYYLSNIECYGLNTMARIHNRIVYIKKI